MNINLIETIDQVARRQKTILWLVGGPIRDELLGRPYDDWDMVCRKAKAVALAVSKRLHAKFITLDDQHKIYRVILPDAFRPLCTLDFAELQGRSIEEDLKRRDFAINAMAVSLTPPSGTLSLKGEGKAWPSPFREKVAEGRMRGLIDPFNGQRDLRSGTIRAMSEKSFVEDPLRLIRAFRFMAQFEFKIEAQTLGWMKKHSGSISKVASERVREELLRLWKQPHSSAALRLMDRVHLLSKLFPEIEACRRTAIRYYGAGGVLKHSFETVENLEWILEQIEQVSERAGERKASKLYPSLPLSLAPSLKKYLHELIGGYPRLAWLKWAAFLHDIGKPATGKVIKGRLRFFEHEHVGAGLAIRAGQRLRCSRQEVQLLGLWVRNHMRVGNLAAAVHITDRALSRFFRDMDEDGIGMVLVSLADHYTYLSKSLWGKGKDPVEKMGYRLLTTYLEKRQHILPDRVVDGHDLMRKLKLKPGPLIGRLLEEIQDAQADGKVKTKEEALLFAKKRAKAAA